MPRRKLPISQRDHPDMQPFCHFDAWHAVIHNRNELTARSYSTGITVFADWLQWSGAGSYSLSLDWPLDEAMLTEEILLDFMLHMVSIVAKTTANTYMASVKSYLTFLDVHGKMPEGIRSIHQLSQKLNYYTRARKNKHEQSRQVAELDAHRQALPQIIDYFCDMPADDHRYSRDLIVMRNRAMTAFMIHTGVRVSELAYIDRKHIETSDGVFNWEPIIIGKGNKPRTIYIKDKRARELILEYLKVVDDRQHKELCALIELRLKSIRVGTSDQLRKTLERYLTDPDFKGNEVRQMIEQEMGLEPLGDIPLFPAFSNNSKTKRIQRASIHKIVKDAVNGLGLHPKLSPHDCRHYYAVKLVRAGIPMEIVQTILGHEDIGTTKGTYAAVARVKATSEWLDRI